MCSLYLLVAALVLYFAKGSLQGGNDASSQENNGQNSIFCEKEERRNYKFSKGEESSKTILYVVFQKCRVYVYCLHFLR